MPTSAVFSTSPTPATSAFDYSSFPAPPTTLNPLKAAIDKVKKQDNAFLTPPVSRSNTRTKDSDNGDRSPPASPAPQTPSSASHYSPNAGPGRFSEVYQHQTITSQPEVQTEAQAKGSSPPISEQALAQYKFPHRPVPPLHAHSNITAALPEWTFCSLPTPPLSVTDGSIDLRSPSPAPSSASSRLRAFTGRFFGSTPALMGKDASNQAAPALRSQSTPPPEVSDLPWLRGRVSDSSEASTQTIVPSRSMSTPDLDPYANALPNERDGIETLRFVPRKCPFKVGGNSLANVLFSFDASCWSFRQRGSLEYAKRFSAMSSLPDEASQDEAAWTHV